MNDRKIVDDSFQITEKRGNGQLRREVWVDQRGHVTRYNFAYINHRIYPKDNGRVVGYDNAHDGHHRHYMGIVESVKFTTLEDIEQQFEHAWVTLQEKK